IYEKIIGRYCATPLRYVLLQFQLLSSHPRVLPEQRYHWDWGMNFPLVIISLHYITVYDPTCDPFRKDVNQKWPRITSRKQCIRAFSDMQIVTGFSILISGFLQLRCGLSAYHWLVIVRLAWISCVTQLSCLTVLRNHLRNHPTERALRLLAVGTLVILLTAGFSFTGNYRWAFDAANGDHPTLSDSAICYIRARPEMNWSFISMLFSMIYLIFAFASRVIDLYDTLSVGVVRRARASISRRIRRILRSVYDWGIVYDRHPVPGMPRSLKLVLCYLPLLAVYFTSWVFVDVWDSAIKEVHWLIMAFTFGIAELIVTIYRPEKMGLQASLTGFDDWSFGQVASVLLLAAPLITIFEFFQEEDAPPAQDKPQDDPCEPAAPAQDEPQDEPCAEEPPPQDKPQDEPQEEPRVQEPRVQELPAQDEPQEQPPVQEPPAQEPLGQHETQHKPRTQLPAQDEPQEQPPVQEPPAQEPLGQHETQHKPRTQEPRAEELPAQDEPQEQPPVQEPPAQEPLGQHETQHKPRTQEPRAEELPAQDEPQQQPRVQEPLAQDKPQEEPSAYKPPAQDNTATQDGLSIIVWLIVCGKLIWRGRFNLCAKFALFRIFMFCRRIIFWPIFRGNLPEDRPTPAQDKPQDEPLAHEPLEQDETQHKPRAQEPRVQEPLAQDKPPAQDNTATQDGLAIIVWLIVWLIVCGKLIWRGRFNLCAKFALFGIFMFCGRIIFWPTFRGRLPEDGPTPAQEEALLRWLRFLLYFLFFSTYTVLGLLYFQGGYTVFNWILTISIILGIVIQIRNLAQEGTTSAPEQPSAQEETTPAQEEPPAQEETTPAQDEEPPLSDNQTVPPPELPSIPNPNTMDLNDPDNDWISHPTISNQIYISLFYFSYHVIPWVADPSRMSESVSDGTIGFHGLWVFVLILYSLMAETVFAGRKPRLNNFLHGVIKVYSTMFRSFHITIWAKAAYCLLPLPILGALAYQLWD
ncbi:hypothetical protein N7491_009980, partial [Penicillium cf. griseofulvum]